MQMNRIQNDNIMVRIKKNRRPSLSFFSLFYHNHHRCFFHFKKVIQPKKNLTPTTKIETIFSSFSTPYIYLYRKKMKNQTDKWITKSKWKPFIINDVKCPTFLSYIVLFMFLCLWVLSVSYLVVVQQYSKLKMFGIWMITDESNLKIIFYLFIFFLSLSLFFLFIIDISSSTLAYRTDGCDCC